VILKSEGFVLIVIDKNLGFSGGCNVGFEYTLQSTEQPDCFFLLNNDARISSNALTACVEVAQKQDAGIVGALIKDAKGRKILFAGAGFPGELFGRRPRVDIPVTGACWPTDRVHGCGMLIKADLLRQRESQLGYYLDPRYFLYGEEIELCVHAKNQGHEILMAGEAKVFHDAALSSGGATSPLVYYYSTRNRVHLARQLLPFGLRALFHCWYLPTRMLRLLQKSATGKFRAAAAIFKGLLDGYRGVTGKWKRHPD
jgi:GT2 family glycosyltransferase